ncbi:SgcJ/EcaC family oxidoreductase [Deinococcus sp. QL22]|uniref:YybH family protein n=1 Tax=Deinococcus sp. QL22 TaxID=2939437 RepID=UPI0020180F17|nr:SgcJ/EcaC family oxidoreductase [Deinococcus sp. QL22]UQN06606.1 nuclear transport factor 2 family protein [Deinococcus sp. QL22]
MTPLDPEHLLDAYIAAVFDKNVEAFMALYADQVCVFDLWGHWAYQGAEAWRGMVVGWFGSLGTERVRVEMQDVQTVRADQLAVIHAAVTYSGLSAEGVRLRSMHNRLTLVCQPDKDAWKIIHEHSSAPVDLATQKVILQR